MHLQPRVYAMVGAFTLLINLFCILTIGSSLPDKPPLVNRAAEPVNQVCLDVSQQVLLSTVEIHNMVPYQGTNEHGQKVSGNYDIHGTGVAVGEHKDYFLVITCRHLFKEGIGRIWVKTTDGVKDDGELVLIDGMCDLACISIPKRKYAKACKISRDNPEKDQAVWQAGFTRNDKDVLELKKKKGTFQGHGGFVKDAPVYTYLLQVFPGDSGSGVWRQSDWKLVGIVWGGLPGEAYVTGVEDIHRFLGSVKSNLQGR